MKRILLKGAAFALLVIVLQVPVELLRGLAPIPSRDALDARPDPPDILYFGDSILDSVAPGDADRRDLVRMVRDLLPDRRIGTVQGSAYGPELFEAFARYAARRPARPPRLLIAINLRSLSPEWEARPEYQFRAEKFRLLHGDLAAAALLRPLNAFKGYSLTPISPGEYRVQPVFREGRPVGRVRDFLPLLVPPPGMTLEEGRFVFRYMNTVTPDSRGVRALRRIAEICREAGMEPRFYVSPVDVETGEREAGPGFRRQVAANVAVLREVLAAEQLRLLDLSARIDAGAFDWRRNLVPNEHLTERGRADVARELAALLRAP
jgi:hypothetical protein